MVMTHVARRVGIAMSVSVLAACGSSAPSSRSSNPENGSSRAAASDPAATLHRIDVPVEAGATIEGLIAVDGHDICARCSGFGRPTVVYFAGWARDRTKQAVSAIGAIETLSDGHQRIC